MLQRLGRLLLVLLCLLLVSASAAQEVKQEKFLLTFIPNIQFAPIYAAIAEGNFTEAGYDITLEYLNEPDVLDLVAAGQNNFGMVSGEQVILAGEQGREIVFVYAWFQQYPIGIVYSTDSDIASLADLQGRKIGIPGRFGASYTGFTSLIGAAGLTESDVQLEEIGFNAPDVFCLGAVEAAVIYVNNEPLQIRNRAAAGDCGAVPDVKVFTVAEVGQLVSNGIITSSAFAESDPEGVTGMVGAFDAGLRLVIDNPAQGYLLSKAYVEDLPLSDELKAALEELAAAQAEFLAAEPDREAIAASRADMLTALQADFAPDELTQFQVLLNSIDLWDAEQLGYSAPEAWENMQTVLTSMGIAQGTGELTTLYSNDFLPESE